MKYIQKEANIGIQMSINKIEIKTATEKYITSYTTYKHIHEYRYRFSSGVRDTLRHQIHGTDKECNRVHIH